MNYSATLKKTCETGASKKSKKFRGKKLCVTGLLMPAPIFYVVIDDFLPLNFLDFFDAPVSQFFFSVPL